LDSILSDMKLCDILKKIIRWLEHRKKIDLIILGVRLCI